MSDLNEDEKSIKIPEVDLPSGLHSRIMVSVVVMKFRKFIIAASAVLTGTLVLSGGYIWSELLEIDAVGIIKIMLRDFVLDSAYVADFFKVILSVFPTGLIAIFLLNLIVAGFAGYLLLTANKLFQNKSNILIKNFNKTQ